MKEKHVVGIFKENSQFQLASIIKDRKQIKIDFLTLKKDLTVLHDLKRKNLIIATALLGQNILIRHIEVSLKNKRAFRKAVPFQLESIVPYSLDQIVVKPIYLTTKVGMKGIFFVASKENILKHVDSWKKIDPEWVSCVPMALYRFGQFVCPKEFSYLILHLGQREVEFLSIIDGVIDSNLTIPIGSDDFLSAYAKDSKCSLAKAEIGRISLEEINEQKFPALFAVLCQFVQEVDRAYYFFSNKRKEAVLNRLLIVGEELSFFSLEEWLLHGKSFSFSLLKVPNYREYEEKTLRRYAISIGLALEVVKGDEYSVQLRQGTFVSSQLLKQTMQLLRRGIFLCVGLSLLAFSFSHLWLRKKERFLQEKLDQYVEYYSKEVPLFTQLPNRDVPIANRVKKINGIVKRKRKSDKVFADPPRVANLFAYLATNPKWNRQEGEKKLEICKLDYEVCKFPSFNNPYQDYQIRVHRLFRSPYAEWARDFHDSLIDDKEFIDCDEEINWDRLEDKYEVIFYLKS